MFIKLHMLISDDIREIIKARKKELKLTWGIIAKKAGVSPFTLSRYVHEKSDMRTEFVIYVLEALGLEMQIVKKQSSVA